MPVKDIYKIKGIEYNLREFNRKKNKIIPILSTTTKKSLCTLLDNYTPLDETSYFITDEEGNITFKYSENFQKEIFIQEAKKYPIIFALYTKNIIEF